jgi:DNA polymerase (family X)
MTKEEIAGVLGQIATLELKGENPFKIRAYARAARAIETFGGNISNLQDEEALAKIPGGGGAVPCDEAANWISAFAQGRAIASARPA